MSKQERNLRIFKGHLDGVKHITLAVENGLGSTAAISSILRKMLHLLKRYAVSKKYLPPQHGWEIENVRKNAVYWNVVLDAYKRDLTEDYSALDPLAPIRALKLGIRLENVLKADGILTMGDLTQALGKGKAYMAKIPNLGEKSLRDTCEAMKKLSIPVPEEYEKKKPMDWILMKMLHHIEHPGNLTPRELEELRVAVLDRMK
jgi:hypothetical protein